jgi:hypothetical protein
MGYQDWLRSIQPQRTPKGARLDLRLYVYPDGHGNVIVQPDDKFGAPVNNIEEAVQVLRDLWEMASNVHEPHGAASHPSEPTV